MLLGPCGLSGHGRGREGDLLDDSGHKHAPVAQEWRSSFHPTPAGQRDRVWRCLCLLGKWQHCGPSMCGKDSARRCPSTLPERRQSVGLGLGEPGRSCWEGHAGNEVRQGAGPLGFPLGLARERDGLVLLGLDSGCRARPRIDPDIQTSRLCHGAVRLEKAGHKNPSSLLAAGSKMLWEMVIY